MAHHLRRDARAQITGAPPSARSSRRKFGSLLVSLYRIGMSMDVTVGYGGGEPQKPRSMIVRPTFVVKGSETMASLEDEGWADVEHEFFVAGVVIDGVGKRSVRRPIDWTRVAGIGAIAVLAVSALLIAFAS
jgi:hypothetical protein